MPEISLNALTVSNGFAVARREVVQGNDIMARERQGLDHGRDDIATTVDDQDRRFVATTLRTQAVTSERISGIPDQRY